MSKNNNKVAALSEIEDEESMILEEEIDENYEPTQEEILEYAQFLGMDMKEDKDLFYIAREGLKAPLPDVWKPAKNRNGDIYYINLKTKQTQWEHPCDEHYKKVYQEAKKKKKEVNKVPKPSTSKFKNSFSFENKSPSSKTSALPLIQDMAITFKPDNDVGRKDTNVSFDSREYSPGNRYESSPTNLTPKALINKKPKEKQSSPKPQKASPQFNLFQEESPNAEELSQLDAEYDDKLFSYKLEKEQTLKKYKEENKETEKNHEIHIKQKMVKDMENLRGRLIENVRSASQAFTENKEEVRHDLTLEYHQKLDFETNKMDQENISLKLKLNQENAQEIEKVIKKEEEKAVQENEMRITDLNKMKKNMLANQSRSDETKKQKEKYFEKVVEDEKEKIEEEFKARLNKFTGNEAQNQQREIERYRNEQKVKINEEKSTFLVAKKRRDSLNIAKENDLKDIYDKKFEIEKSKIDNELSENLKNYENSEITRKNQNIQDIQFAELSLEKDKKKMVIQKEIENLKANYQRRLVLFETQLKDHLNNEKKIIDQEMMNAGEKYQLEVENIRMDITNKDDILNQINKSQKEDENLTKKIEEIDKHKTKQQKENNLLKEKLERLKEKTTSQNKVQSQSSLKDLESKIKEAESLLKNLSKPHIKENQPSTNTLSIRASQTSNNIKGNFPLVKIIEDIDEIKTILVKDEQDLANSSQGSKNNMFKLLSPKSSMRSPDKSIYGSSIKLETKPVFERWNTLYTEELDKISDLKDKLEECKEEMIKKQHNLALSQERFKKDIQEFKLSNNKSTQKKSTLRQVKRTLDKQVQKFGEIISALKQADVLLEAKESLCNDLGKAICRMERGHLDIEKVEAIYQKCKRVDVRIPFIEDERQAYFYETWENLLENHSCLDADILESRNNLEATMRKNFTDEGFFTREQRDGLFVEKRIDNQSMLASTGNLRFSYTNLFQFLDSQTKSQEVSPESVLLQKRMHEAHEDRNQVQTFLKSHSSWLKDIKQKLNHQLYEKPSLKSPKDHMSIKTPLF